MIRRSGRRGPEFDSRGGPFGKGNMGDGPCSSPSLLARCTIPAGERRSRCNTTQNRIAISPDRNQSSDIGRGGCRLCPGVEEKNTRKVLVAAAALYTQEISFQDPRFQDILAESNQLCTFLSKFETATTAVPCLQLLLFAWPDAG